MRNLLLFHDRFPSRPPTKFPFSKYPTRFPTAPTAPRPSRFPTRYPSAFPTTKHPSPFPTEETPEPTTPAPTGFPLPGGTRFPTRFPVFTRFPTRYPLPGNTRYPSRFPTKFPSASPTAFPSKEPTTFPSREPYIDISFQTVQAHSSLEDCWVIIGGGFQKFVYDVTDFAEDEFEDEWGAVLARCGGDATAAITDLMAAGNEDAIQLLTEHDHDERIGKFSTTKEPTSFPSRRPTKFPTAFPSRRPTKFPTPRTLRH